MDETTTEILTWIGTFLSEGVLIAIIGGFFGFWQHKNSKNMERQNRSIERQTKLAEDKSDRDSEIGKLRIQKDRVKESRDRAMDDFIMTFSAAYLNDDKDSVRQARYIIKDTRRNTFLEDEFLSDEMLRIYQKYDDMKTDERNQVNSCAKG